MAVSKTDRESIIRPIMKRSLLMVIFFYFQLSMMFHLSAAQVVMEELKAYNIDPLNLNGTEPYTELTIDQIILKASGGFGG